MSAGIWVEARRIALRGAALAVIGGLAAGCSSGVQRFTTDNIFTGSTPNQRAIIKAPADQPFPGDLGVKPVASGTDYTGSVNRAAVEPVNLSTGGIERSELPPVSSAKAKMAALAAPAVAAVAAVKAKASGLKPSQVSDKAADKTKAVASAAKSALAPTPIADTPVDTISTGAVAKAKAAKDAASASAEPAKRGWSKAGGTQITLREGETLYNLSRRFGVPVAAIVSANGLKDASAVTAGQKILIPTYVYSSDVPVSAPDSNPEVAASKSSRGKKTDAPANKAPAPGDAPDRSSVAVLPTTPRPKEKAAQPAATTGAEKTARASAPEKPAKAAVPTKVVKTETIKPANSVAGGYTVKAGDSLWTIAKKAGTTTAAIKAANKLDGGALRVGQVLVMPSVAAAAEKSADVDPIITGSAKSPAKAAEKKDAQALPTYTAPSKTNAAIAEAEKQTTAAAPEQTGIGKMRWPARGKVVTGYGAKSTGKASDGIDIALPSGTPVKAAENGVVIYAGDGLKEFGKTVLVRHEDGLVTVYGHNGDIKVKRGDTVARGQEIASSGMSGETDTPKLHFEVRKDSTPVDPAKYLD